MNTTLAAPMMLAVFNLSSSEKVNAQVAGPLAGKGISGNPDSTTRFTLSGERHGTLSHKNGNWTVWHQTSPLATPEPGSLMLLSTGLAGIAGMVRRKFRRA
jgi:PEP-CTERM motif